MSTKDLHGLAMSTASPATAQAFNQAVVAYLSYRADAPLRLRQLLAADPDFGFGQLLKGHFSMLAFNLASVPLAREALENARRLLADASPREKAHVAALEHWVAGDIDATLATWEQILDEHPLDVLAFRLHHFLAFWYGRPEVMAAAADAAFQRWSPELAGWPALLACRCFAHEEMGNYAIAEAAGRQAIALAPGDLWAAHGVAHVLEMQGRRDEGIAWLAGLEPHWEDGNNLKHHLWWHRGLYHFERREFAEVLTLYDRRFRDLTSPLTQAQPDMYIDVQNAASMLFRLQRQGVDVGNRWNELADKAEARIGDCLSAFTLPHWMMALAATGRDAAAARLLAGMREYAAGAATTSRVVREVAVPACEAVLAHRRGDHPQALALLRPIVDRLSQLGGSHAQQDVLKQLYLDAALKAERDEDVRSILVRAARAYAMPPARRVGYEEAARRFAG
jgi:tetratricopeptide (TPR) repeat protein